MQEDEPLPVVADLGIRRKLAFYRWIRLLTVRLGPASPVEGWATVLKPGGRLFLMCFSDEEPGEQGPRRVLKKELHDAFAVGWAIESIKPVQVEVRADLKDISFSEGGPRAWFVVVRRLEWQP